MYMVHRRVHSQECNIGLKLTLSGRVHSQECNIGLKLTLSGRVSCHTVRRAKARSFILSLCQEGYSSVYSQEYNARLKLPRDATVRRAKARAMPQGCTQQFEQCY